MRPSTKSLYSWPKKLWWRSWCTVNSFTISNQPCWYRKSVEMRIYPGSLRLKSWSIIGISYWGKFKWKRQVKMTSRSLIFVVNCIWSRTISGLLCLKSMSCTVDGSTILASFSGGWMIKVQLFTTYLIMSRLMICWSLFKSMFKSRKRELLKLILESFRIHL